nr:hypothetical protein GCM10017611_00500 [Rhodococcus wratislaviensis]
MRRKHRNPGGGSGMAGPHSVMLRSATTQAEGSTVTHPHTKFSIATEWLGRIAAVMSAVLLVLVLIAIHEGLAVRQSTRAIVDNFTHANQYFDERADLTAPARVRKELEDLRGVLAELNTATAADVDQLATMLPDMQALVAAGGNDVNIAHQLHGVSSSLQGAAGSLHAISADADAAVVKVNDRLLAAQQLADQLNAELGRTTVKLAPLPAQGNVIPSPSGGK